MTFGMIYNNSVITSRGANFTGLYGRYEAYKVFMVTLELSSIAKMGIGWMNIPEPKNDF